ncbi:MAG: molybdenum cofactor biosynthesis protein MoaE [Saprospiraceae bacterium]|nr:molybdenum cofactor biosynthesis protein MoaE [Saprospiraceae bacterium]
MNIFISISEEALDVQQCMNLVRDDAAGGIDIFVGTVREWTNGRQVVQLEFEAYAEMAIAEMRKIAEVAVKEYQLCAMAIQHRVGMLEIGEIPVIIAASAPHRVAAFEACRYAIDTLKEQVPIWKKEIFSDGAVWVAAHP